MASISFVSPRNLVVVCSCSSRKELKFYSTTTTSNYNISFLELELSTRTLNFHSTTTTKDYNYAIIFINETDCHRYA